MANCFATSVGSKALTVKQAVVIASVCEFFGALLMGSNVAKTIRKGIADVNCYKDNPGLLIYGMTCVIIAVAIWLVLASYLELPVSTTHSCVGGIIGMTLMTRSTRCVIWNKDPDNMAFENFPWTGGVAQIVISWVLSPVASGVCAAALYAVVRYGIFAWENCYLRARIAFPLVVFFTVTVNVTYFIVKGAKGQAERFGTVGMVREAKEEGNLAPAIGMGSIFGAVAAAVAAGMLPMLSKKVEAEDFTDSVAGAQADPADVEAKAVDAEAGAAAVDAEATELDGAKAYIGGQLTRDTHKDLKTDKVVGAIHANVKEFDPRAEFFFRYVQVFTAMVDSFSHGANDVANAMGPFAAAYLAYKKGEVRSKQEMPSEVMLWILALGGAGIVVGLATYGYKIMNAMGVKLTAITPSRGTCIELGAAFVIIYGTGQGWPLSTTHCQIGATVAVGLFEGRKGVNAWLFAKCCFGWVITLVVVGTTTALLVGPSPEPLKGEYCDNYCQVNSREWMQ